MDPQDDRLTGPFYASDGPMTRFYEYPALTEWEYRQEVARRSLNEVRRARELKSRSASAPGASSLPKSARP